MEYIHVHVLFPSVLESYSPVLHGFHIPRVPSHHSPAPASTWVTAFVQYLIFGGKVFAIANYNTSIHIYEIYMS